MAFIPKPFFRLFSTNADLRALKQRAEEQESLLHLVKSRLPDPLCDHCTGANLAGDTLQLIVDSPVWNTKMRYMQGSLIKALAQADIKISGIKVITRTQEFPSQQRAPRLAQGLSQTNAEVILENASAVKDQQLRHALIKLASRFST